MAIICSEMQSVFLEEKSRTTVSYEEQIMPEVYSQIFPFFHHHMTCVQEKSTMDYFVIYEPHLHSHSRSMSCCFIML